MSGLDFVIVAPSDGEYEVWTPDQTGACIGAGTTPRRALNDALANLEATAAAIHEKLETCDEVEEKPVKNHGISFE